MYLEQFIYLKTIAQCQSLKSAAQKLFISHQALSRSIHNLETELGCPLLIRCSRGVTLTEEGKYVLSIADHIVGALDEMTQHFELRVHRPAGKLRLLFNQQEYTYRFGKVLSFFYKSYPSLIIQHQIVNNADMIQLLRNDEADVGICNFIELNGAANFNIPDDFIFHEFSRERLGAIFSKDSALNQYSKVSLKTLSRFPVIIHASEGNDEGKIPALFLLSDYHDIHTLAAVSDIMFSKFLQDDLGWAICPSSAVQSIRYPVAFCPIQDKAYDIRGYITKRSKKAAPLLDFFLDFYIDFSH